MGFNYLQTDDRDDYFSLFDNNKQKIRHKVSYTLINPHGLTLYDNVSKFVIRKYCKTQYLPYGKNERYVWQDILRNKGYILIHKIT